MTDPTYKECVALYFGFFKEKNKGTPPKFNAGDGKIMKDLIKHLQEVGNGNSRDNINAIFSNWKTLERHNKFYRHNHDIKMIYSCINSIISILTSTNGQNHYKIINSYK